MRYLIMNAMMIGSRCDKEEKIEFHPLYRDPRMRAKVDIPADGGREDRGADDRTLFFPLYLLYRERFKHCDGA